VSVQGSGAESLARAGLEWLCASAVSAGDHLAWTGVPSGVEVDPTLYSGGAGIVLAFLEGHGHFGDDRWADRAQRGARDLAARVEGWAHSSLYFGTMGMAVALRAVADQLQDTEAEHAVGHALAAVRASFDGERWGPQFDLLGGNAGIALGAVQVGDIELAEMAVMPYLHAAEPTPAGVTWENRRGMRPRRHHISHGTLGITYALATTAHAAGRGDLMDLALAGAADVVARNDAPGSGFLVPHSDPQQDPDRIERYNYGWCHGPTGDAQVFRLLHWLTADQTWLALQDACWRTVTESGIPRRLRPGFWDNNGHCCGTAGVLALSCDRVAETGEGLEFAAELATDLEDRAIVDGSGARWSNDEHRAVPPELEPHQGWAMGNAGIVRELLRYARITAGRDDSYAVPWPDQPAVLKHTAESYARPTTGTSG
jgi:Lanthionine synthetase C-like protein